MTNEIDARGNVTRYQYDPITSKPKKVTDRCGNETSYTYDASGRTTKVTAPNGGTVEYDYNSYDDLTQITRGDGQSYTMGYDAYRNLTSVKVGKLIKIESKANLDDCIAVVLFFIAKRSEKKHEHRRRIRQVAHENDAERIGVKYDILSHPNIALSADGESEKYDHGKIETEDFGIEIVDIADYPDLNLNKIPRLDEYYAGIYAYDEDETEELLNFLKNLLESEEHETKTNEAVDGGTDGSSAH